MPSGGARQGKPGTLYPNRRDMAQPARTAKGQTYGEAGAELASQKAIPLPQRGHVPQGNPGQDMQAAPEPGSVPSLSMGSALPDEPVTAGLRLGPGPGPEALQAVNYGPAELSILRGIFRKFPNEDLRRLLEFTETNI